MPGRGRTGRTGARELALDVSKRLPTEGETRLHFRTTDVGVFLARVGGHTAMRRDDALTRAWAAWHMGHVLVLPPGWAVTGATRTLTGRPVGVRLRYPRSPFPLSLLSGPSVQACSTRRAPPVRPVCGVTPAFDD